MDDELEHPTKIDFYIDPETGEPHIYLHSVSEAEVAEVLASEGIRWKAGDGKVVVIGKTLGGRFLQIVLVTVDGSVETEFVITAYEPKKEVVRAFRRRMKKKGKQ